MSKGHLSTYLNDHLAGANIAIEIVEHLLKESPGLAGTIEPIRKEIEEDREQLRTLMGRLEISESQTRRFGSFLAEGLTEVKLEIDDDPHGPLRCFERLEALVLGIDGKIALWQALESVSIGDMDFSRQIQRARNQRAQIESLRIQAASGALAA